MRPGSAQDSIPQHRPRCTPAHDDRSCRWVRWRAFETQVQGMVAEYERAKILERSRRGTAMGHTPEPSVCCVVRPVDTGIFEKEMEQRKGATRSTWRICTGGWMSSRSICSRAITSTWMPRTFSELGRSEA